MVSLRCLWGQVAKEFADTSSKSLCVKLQPLYVLDALPKGDSSQSSAMQIPSLSDAAVGAN